MSPRIFPLAAGLVLLAAACSGGSSSAPELTVQPTTTAAPVATLPPTTEPIEAAGCASLPVGFSSVQLEGGGVNHDVRIYVPTSFAGEPLPVVMNWHGLGSDGIQQIALSNYETLAEAEGFITAHPSGVADPISGRTSWELVDSQDPNRDDMAFADALMDTMIDTWCADADRIYSTGMSNGGFFTARLVCERADRIAAAVSVAGLSHQPDCSPSRSVPFRAYHGTNDDLVPFDDTRGSSLIDPNNPDPLLAGLLAETIPDEFAEFAADASCSAEPEVVEVSGEVKRFDYSDCTDGVPMSFFEIANGGHTWPGSPLGPLFVDSLGYTTTDVSATIDGWAFMSAHKLP